jgi:hypothetical protein
VLNGAGDYVIEIQSSTPMIERLLRYFPLIGPYIANLLYGFRTRAVVESVERELRRRRRPELNVWGDDIPKALFAQSICELAMLEMGWPNDHFLPTDPAAVVFWNHRDSLDFATALKDIETNIEVDIDQGDIEVWFEKTLGEVVDALWQKQQAVNENDSWPPAPKVSD